MQQQKNIGLMQYHQHRAMRCQEYISELEKFEAMDDFRIRLRSCGRGLIVMANAAEDDNGSLFFILSSTPDLQNKHTISGRATGESIYSILKLEEALVNENDRPLYPPRLIKTIILNNPFSHIIPRITVQRSEEVKDSSKTAAVKDLNLLSFGGEAKEDEEESVILNKKFTGKGKSAHDHLTDPKLSSQTAVEPSGLANKKRKEGRSSDWESDAEVRTQEELEVVKKEKVIIKGFITQDGDSTGTGEGGERHGQSFKDEFHTKSRFRQRHLIAVVNAGKGDNGSQFFFTLNSTLDL
ncbi:Peptidyl-prolyl cis-trans isomerase CWC27 like protein [Eufriesea mexicana]|uniref:Spliceosome-associated protein CWC27 homolog n=1 Tax=Eufriesea mexicana TaxID=516756 RepID=A0A310SJS9_9HYME|nr:Peptidyl-prolyl cis-trans isomerase CWC27 like protein [Eufriesea mexicana]